MEVNETLRNPGEVYLNNQKHVQRNDLQSHIRGKTTDKFDVKTGVRLSPLLFLVSTDWTMRTATEGKKNGIQWTGIRKCLFDKTCNTN